VGWPSYAKPYEYVGEKKNYGTGPYLEMMSVHLDPPDRTRQPQAEYSPLAPGQLGSSVHAKDFRMPTFVNTFAKKYSFREEVQTEISHRYKKTNFSRRYN
jgi:hypothetical protein